MVYNNNNPKTLKSIKIPHNMMYFIAQSNEKLKYVKIKTKITWF